MDLIVLKQSQTSKHKRNRKKSKEKNKYNTSTPKCMMKTIISYVKHSAKGSCHHKILKSNMSCIPFLEIHNIHKHFKGSGHLPSKSCG